MLGLKRQVLKTIAVRVGGRAKYFEACPCPLLTSKGIPHDSRRACITIRTFNVFGNILIRK